MMPQCSPDRLRSDFEDSCREAFCTALLLTGSVAYAELVVIEAIELWNPKDTAEGAFTRSVIDKSLQAREPADFWAASPLLRKELRPVLRLSGTHRYCFVLRVLMNLSRQACGRILGLTGLQVDRYTTAALADLARLSERER